VYLDDIVGRGRRVSRLHREDGVGSETMNADELVDGLVNLGAKSGAFGYGWLSICPGDVDCKKYES
jgi:hypothetical protein